MKATVLSMLVVLPLFVLLPGCKTTGAANPTSLAKLEDNTAYVGPDGTVLVKGFAGRYTKNFVCILPTGSYRLTVDASSKGEAGLEAKGVKATGAGSRETKTELTVIYKPQDRMLAVQQVLGNACVMLGNGVFGDTCTKLPNDGEKWCSGAAPKTTLDNYNAFVSAAIDHLLTFDRHSISTLENPPPPLP